MLLSKLVNCSSDFTSIYIRVPINFSFLALGLNMSASCSDGLLYNYCYSSLFIFIIHIVVSEFGFYILSSRA